MDKETDRLFVITGGPGSGKTTLIAALAEAGYAVTEEAGRAIIRDQTAIGGDALPSRNPAGFAELMLSWEIRSHRAALAQPGPVFCDRGVPDVAGYLRLTGLPIPPHVAKAAATFRYNRRVFIAPPWAAIYRQDGERSQDFAEAVRTYEAVVATYREYGYELVELPRVGVKERVRFVTARASSGGLSE